MKIENLEKEVKEKDLIISQSEELLRQMLTVYRQNRNNCCYNNVQPNNKYNSIASQNQMMFPCHLQHNNNNNYPQKPMTHCFSSSENNNSFTSFHSRISPLSSFSDKSNYDLQNVISRQDSQIQCLLAELNKYQQCQYRT